VANSRDKVLPPEKARRVYDRIGSLQDSQAFYEDRATDELIRHADFADAQHVFEFGCGTGRFAETLLRDHLPDTADYRGVDLSVTMVALARERLAAFRPRSSVDGSDGTPPASEPDAAYDRFVSNYVLDLLAKDDIAAVIQEAHRMLQPGGLLCAVSLTNGTATASRMLTGAWRWVQSVRPALVGGCRPIELTAFVQENGWRIRHHAKVVSFAVPSDVLVAERV
jgi:ubiquinone/menaquinone biosynthesis C-methylase UbiE